jgi:hypothetical protein
MTCGEPVEFSILRCGVKWVKNLIILAIGPHPQQRETLHYKIDVYRWGLSPDKLHIKKLEKYKKTVPTEFVQKIRFTYKIIAKSD